jgi:hypothetical protein
MSKRKSRKNSKPNLPEETLERARQEAGLAPKPQREESEPEADEEAEDVEVAAPAVSIPRSEIPRRRDLPAQPVKRRAKPRRQMTYEEMSPEDVAYALEHPTKVVTEEALREQYGYVLADLRSMAILAAVLFIALIVIAAVVIR